MFPERIQKNRTSYFGEDTRWNRHRSISVDLVDFTRYQDMGAVRTRAGPKLFPDPINQQFVLIPDHHLAIDDDGMGPTLAIVRG